MNQLTGSRALIRLAWRRDRVFIPVGIVAMTAIAVASVKATFALYPAPASLGPAVRAVLTNPASKALYGPVSDLNDPDAFAVYKTTMMGAVFLALFAAAIVRRHTRVEEEHGRLDLLGATVLGRRAPLWAATVVAAVAVITTCVATAIGYIAVGADPAGSIASVCGWAAVGFAFIGLSALAAQITSTGRGCTGLTTAVVAVAFGVRAVTDTRASASTWLGWVSPLAWSQRADAFGADRWWVVGIGAAFMAVCGGVAFAMLERRDLGSGMLPNRPGPDRASRLLSSPLGLATRLQRGGALGWALVFIGLGAVVGALAGSASDMLKDPQIVELLRNFGGGSADVASLYLATELGIAAVVAAAYGVAAILRTHTEEVAGHTEMLLATATTRMRLLGAQGVIACVGSAALMTLTGIAIGVTSTDPSGPGTAELLGAAIARVPAIWVCVALTVLVVGWAPRHAAAVAWSLLVGFLLLGEFGALLKLPGWIRDLSPFAHAPTLPGGDFAPLTALALLAVAGAVAAAGAAGFQRRDIGG
jgi:ABC-2 type transport system permease protein